MNHPIPPALETPTRVRYGVLSFACVLSMITYLDRVCMGTVAPYIEKEFDLTADQIGYIFGAFTLAYAAFEVPSGWLGDRFGPRRTLIRIVLWWSFFTALTGLIYPSNTILHLGIFTTTVSFASLLVVRFLFGVGEAGAYPNIARAFHNWFPFKERGSAKGTVWMAGRLAGGITPFIVLALLYETNENGVVVTHWRHTFWIFGVMGVIWCVFFYFWFRDRPEQKSSVNAAELAMIREGDLTHSNEKLHVPWLRLFLSPNLWLLCLMYFCASFGWYFNITFLPRFLGEQFGLEKGEKWTAQWWSFSTMQGLPLLFGSLACLVGGLLTDWFIRRTGNVRWGRRLFGMLGHGVCGICYFVALAILYRSPERGERTLEMAWMFVLAVSLASFWNDITMGAAWASCLDIGGRFSGIVAGCMNTIGNLGGFTANIVTGNILHSYTRGLERGTDAYFNAAQPAWILNLFLFGFVYVIAVGLWLRFDATRPVTPEAVGKTK